MTQRNVKTIRYLYAFQCIANPPYVAEDSGWELTRDFFESDKEFEAVMMAGGIKMRYRKLEWSALHTYEKESWMTRNGYDPE